MRDAKAREARQARDAEWRRGSPNEDAFASLHAWVNEGDSAIPKGTPRRKRRT